MGADLIVLDNTWPNAEVQREILLLTEVSEVTLITAGGQGPAGPRGVPGPAGGALPLVSFAFGDVTPLLIHTLPDAALLTGLQMVIQQPFNGAGAQLVLRTQDGQVLMAEDQNAPGLVATFETTPAAQLPAGAAIYLDITPGAGATEGAGQILLNLH